MKKLLTLIAFLTMALPAVAVDADEIGKARVRVGPVRANVKNTSDNGRVSISRAGDLVTFGCSYAKTKVNGIKTSSTGIAMALQFDSIVGDFEQGKTYDLSHSNPSTLTSVVTASRFKNLRGRGISTLSELMGDAVPVATGKFKVTKYNPETGEISGNLNVRLSPTVVTRGTKNKLSNKAQRIQMKITTVVE